MHAWEVSAHSHFGNNYCGITLIATFLYKNDSIELRYSDYEDSFQFLSHFRRIQV
jgi:hypothetical protein